MEPQATRAGIGDIYVGDIYSGVFKASPKNDTITAWREDAVAEYDSLLFSNSNEQRVEFPLSLDCHFETVDEFVEDKENSRPLYIFVYLIIIAIGLSGVYKSLVLLVGKKKK